MTIRSRQIQPFAAPVSTATMAFADVFQPIPAPLDASSTWQVGRPPEVIRATFMLAGRVGDFHLQVTQLATIANQVALVRNAPCLAHKKKQGAVH